VSILQGLRTMVFVDGSNLFWACKQCCFKIDILKLVDKLSEGKMVVGRHYYNSIPENPSQKQIGFYCALTHQGFKVITKTLKPRWQPSGEIIFVEKGVDVAVTTDMLHLAIENVYDIAILVSGDGDYVDAVKYIEKSRGKRVEIASFEKCVSDELRRIADRFISLDSIKGEIERRDNRKKVT